MLMPSLWLPPDWRPKVDTTRPPTGHRKVRPPRGGGLGSAAACVGVACFAVAVGGRGSLSLRGESRAASCVRWLLPGMLRSWPT